MPSGTRFLTFLEFISSHQCVKSLVKSTKLNHRFLFCAQWIPLIVNIEIYLFWTETFDTGDAYRQNLPRNGKILFQLYSHRLANGGTRFDFPFSIIDNKWRDRKIYKLKSVWMLVLSHKFRTFTRIQYYYIMYDQIFFYQTKYLYWKITNLSKNWQQNSSIQKDLIVQFLNWEYEKLLNHVRLFFSIIAKLYSVNWVIYVTCLLKNIVIIWGDWIRSAI